MHQIEFVRATECMSIEDEIIIYLKITQFFYCFILLIYKLQSFLPDNN
jgi:hypothetical protein